MIVLDFMIPNHDDGISSIDTSSEEGINDATEHYMHQRLSAY